MADHWRLVLSNGVVVDVVTHAVAEGTLGWDSHPTYVAYCAWIEDVDMPSIPLAVETLAGEIVLQCHVADLNVWVEQIVAPGRLTQAEHDARLLKQFDGRIADVKLTRPAATADQSCHECYRARLDEARMARNIVRGNNARLSRYYLSRGNEEGEVT